MSRPKIRPLPRSLVATAALAWVTLSAAPCAHGAWLGLADGDYAISLVCDQSTVIPCPSTTSGTLSINGPGADALDLSLNGQHFVGSPFDGTDGNASVQFEYSAVSTMPFSFLTIARVTSGNYGPYGVGERFWQYCVNAGPGSCAVTTVGHWSASSVVSAPAPVTLIAASLALMVAWRRKPMA